MKTRCSCCGEKKMCFEYTGRESGGTNVKFLLCNSCLKGYLDSGAIRVETEQGKLYRIEGGVIPTQKNEHMEGPVNNQIAAANNNFQSLSTTQPKRAYIPTDSSKKSGWTSFVKVLNIFIFIGVIIAGAIVGTSIEEVTGTLIGIVLGALVGAIVVSFSMMFVEISENLATLVEQNERKK